MDSDDDSANSNPLPASSVHVGTPSPEFQDWETKRVYFHNFDALNKENDRVMSSAFSCLGHQWTVLLCLEEGNECGNEMLGVLIYLFKESMGRINVKFGLSVKNCKNQGIADYSTSHVFDTNENLGYGFDDLLPHQKALNNLVLGTLVVEVRLKRHSPFPFIPKNPSRCKIVQELFMDKETADVIFEVTMKQAIIKETDSSSTTTKKGKIWHTTFYAHSLILKKAAPLLAELCATENSPFHIPNVSPETFHHLLQYIYGHDIHDFGAELSHTKEIIEAADRYGLTNLKLEAEALFVSSMALNLENLMEYLHFSDSKNCALLKESIVDFIVKKKVEILEERVLVEAPIDLVSDVLAAMLRIEKKDDTDDINDLYSAMSISDLRDAAFDKKLNIDGSRETLMTALKQVKEASDDDDHEEDQDDDDDHEEDQDDADEQDQDGAAE